MHETNGNAEVTSFGIAWDAEWVAPNRLRVRGWQAVTGLSALASWDVESLIATVDGALEAANWRDFDRSVALNAIRALYADDLAAVSPSTS